MNTSQIPIDIFDTICDFAYGVLCKKDMFLDLDWVDRVQKSIPGIFFKPTIPAKPIFGPFNPRRSEHLMYLRNKFRELFTPNPYVRGNPYYPTEALETQFGVFSATPYFIALSLSNKHVRQHKKYKGSIVKNVDYFTRLSIKHWNSYLASVFTHPLWLDPNSYEPRDHVTRNIIPRWIEAMHSATFLVSSVPV